MTELLDPELEGKFLKEECCELHNIPGKSAVLKENQCDYNMISGKTADVDMFIMSTSTIQLNSDPKKHMPSSF